MKQIPFYLLGIILLSCSSTPTVSRFFFNHSSFQYMGRFLDEDSMKIFAWSASRISFRFEGDSICLHLARQMNDSSDQSDYYVLELDHESRLLTVSSDPIWLRNLGTGEHRCVLLKRTEATVSTGTWEGVSGGPDLRLLPPEAPPDLSMEVIGNSITCGYGIEGATQHCDFSPETEDATHTYAFLAAKEMGMSYTAVCFSGKGIWRNYGRDTVELMSELWHRYMPQRKDRYDHSESRTHVMINLGTNDFAHEIPPRREFCAKYLQLVREVREAHPSAHIIMLTGSMMQGTPLETLQSYLAEVKETLEAEGMNHLYRFDLSPQGELGYGCDWHPNLAQNKKNAQELVEFLSGI